MKEKEGGFLDHQEGLGFDSARGVILMDYKGKLEKNPWVSPDPLFPREELNTKEEHIWEGKKMSEGIIFWVLSEINAGGLRETQRRTDCRDDIEEGQRGGGIVVSRITLRRGNIKQVATGPLAKHFARCARAVTHLSTHVLL